MNNIIKYFMFILTPAFVFFFNFIEIFKYKYIKRENLWIIVIFMGILGYLVAPTGDLYRHTMKYYRFQESNIEEFLKYLKNEVDFLLPVIFFVLSKLKISVQYYQMIAVIFCYGTSFYILNNILKYKKKKIYLILYFLIEFFVIANGLRSGVASHLFILGVYYKINNQLKKTWICFMSAIIMHFFIFPVVVLFLITPKNSKKIKYIFIFSIFGFFLGKNIVNSILNFIPFTCGIRVRIIEPYLGYWARDFLEDYSIKYFLYLKIKQIMYFPIFIYLIFKINKLKLNKINSFLLLLFSFTNFTYYFIDIFGRYSYICRILGILIIIVNNMEPRKILEKFFLLLSFLTFLANIYAMKIYILNSEMYKLLYEPIPVIFYEVHYEKQWIDKKINNDGSIK